LICEKFLVVSQLITPAFLFRYQQYQDAAADIEYDDLEEDEIALEDDDQASFDE
jgi:hypothetical protein